MVNSSDQAHHWLPAAELRRWRAHLQEELNRAEDVGYFGPDSAMWLINREAAMTLGLTRALLMQVAHPWVAQAVVDHSTFGTHPLSRLLATAQAAELLIFGSRSQADAVAAHIRGVHTRINGLLREDVGRWRKGTRYSAEDPEALLWVWSTLVDTSFVMYESCLGQLPSDVASGYLNEAAHIAVMLGVPPDMVPRDRPSLKAYMHTVMNDGTVAVGESARRLAHDLLTLRPSSRLHPLWVPYRSLLCGVALRSMPQELRAQYGLSPRRWHDPLFRSAGRLCRLVLPRLPDRMRIDPVTRLALQRAG